MGAGMPAQPWEHARMTVQCDALVMDPCAKIDTERQLKGAHRADELAQRIPCTTIDVAV